MPPTAIFLGIGGLSPPPPDACSKLWSVAPWTIHIFTDDVQNSFGPQYTSVYSPPPSPTPPFRIVTGANQAYSPSALHAAILAAPTPEFLATPPPRMPMNALAPPTPGPFRRWQAP